MEDDKFVLFDDVSFQDLMKKIYSNSEKKEAQIAKLVDDLSKLVKTSFDASVITPLIKEYLEVGVKNDDALVKLASIVQRYMSALNKGSSKGTTENPLGLSDEEKEELRKNAIASIRKIG